MPKTAAEKQRDYRFRQRELRRLAGTLRSVGRPKRDLPYEWGTVTRKVQSWMVSTHEVLLSDGIEEIGFREFRRRLNMGARQSEMFSADEVAGLLHRFKKDHFFDWDEESRARYPRIITVLPDPEG